MQVGEPYPKYGLEQLLWRRYLVTEQVCFAAWAELWQPCHIVRSVASFSACKQWSGLGIASVFLLILLSSGECPPITTQV
jgi:hypothetical protein